MQPYLQPRRQRTLSHLESSHLSLSLLHIFACLEKSSLPASELHLLSSRAIQREPEAQPEPSPTSHHTALLYRIAITCLLGLFRLSSHGPSHHKRQDGQSLPSILAYMPDIPTDSVPKLPFDSALSSQLPSPSANYNNHHPK